MRHGQEQHQHRGDWRKAGKLSDLNRRRMALLWVIVHHGINEAQRLMEMGISKEQWVFHMRCITAKLLFDQSDNSGLLNDFLRQNNMQEIAGAPQLYRSAEALRQAELLDSEYTPTDSGVSFVKGFLDMLGKPAQWPYRIPVEAGKPQLNQASYVPTDEEAEFGWRHEPRDHEGHGMHGEHHHERGQESGRGHGDPRGQRRGGWRGRPEGQQRGEAHNGHPHTPPPAHDPANDATAEGDRREHPRHHRRIFRA